MAEPVPGPGGLPGTHRGSEQLQVLVVHLHVQALVAAVHLEAAEEALASGGCSRSRRSLPAQGLLTCTPATPGRRGRCGEPSSPPGSSDTPWGLWSWCRVGPSAPSSGLLASGTGSGRESGEPLPQQHPVLPHGSSRSLPAPAPRQQRWLARGCSQPGGTGSRAHLPPGEPHRHPEEGVAQVVCDEIVTLVPAARTSTGTG